MSQLLDAAQVRIAGLDPQGQLLVRGINQALFQIVRAVESDERSLVKVNSEVAVVRKLAETGGDSASLLSAITDLETAIGNIPAGTDISALETAVANLRIVADTISTGVTDIESDLTTARTELAIVQNNLVSASTDIDAITASLATAATALTNIQDALDSNVSNAIAAVQAAVDGLPEGIDTTALDSAVSTLMGEISDVSTAVGGVKTVVDSTVTKVDDVKVVVDDTVNKVDDVKVVVDGAAGKVDEVKTVVDGVPGKVTDARDHVEDYRNWEIGEGRIGEQPMIVANGKYLPGHSFSVSIGSHGGGIFSDGTTIWIIRSGNIEAYSLSDSSRDSAKDRTISNFVQNSLTYTLNGIAYFDSPTAWIVYQNFSSNLSGFRIRSINMSTGTLGTHYSLSGIAGVHNFRGFGDGTHVWLQTGQAFTVASNFTADASADIDFEALLDFPEFENRRGATVASGIIYVIGRLSSDDRWDVFAVNLNTHGRDPCRDIRTLHINNNRNPIYLMLQSNRFYVIDHTHNAVFAYQHGDKKVGYGRIIL